MDEQNNSTADAKDSAGSKVTPGERLDHLLAGAKRLTDTASGKAKEFVDAAAPRLKEIGDTASHQMSEAIERQKSEGSVSQKAMAFYSGGGKRRKQVVLGAALLLAVLMLLVVLSLVTGSSGPTKSNFAQVQTGMSQDAVNRLLGNPTATFKGQDGVISTWMPHNSNQSAILVAFADGKVTQKAVEGSPVVGSDYATMDVPTLALLIEQKLMPGQGIVPEAMWQRTVYPELCSNQYSLAATDLQGHQLADRVQGECRRAIQELQKKLRPQ